jgi:hypothetical protein
MKNDMMGSVTSEDECFEEIDVSALSFEFRGANIPVNVASAVTPGEAQMVLECKQFTSWLSRCEKTYANKHFNIHSVEIQSVDPFGQRYVAYRVFYPGRAMAFKKAARD